MINECVTMKFAIVDDHFQVCSKIRFQKKFYHKHIRIIICIRDLNPWETICDRFL